MFFFRISPSLLLLCFSAVFFPLPVFFFLLILVAVFFAFSLHVIFLFSCFFTCMLSCFLGLFASFSSCFIYSLLFLPVLFHVLKIMRKMWLAIRALYIDRLVVEFPFFGGIR